MAADLDPAEEREEIRGLLADIRALNERVQTVRAEGVSPEHEELQLKRLRTLAQLARQYRLLAQDQDLDETESDVDLLRNALESGAGE
jgi:hypothetical protein